jgi:hypothetical protein
LECPGTALRKSPTGEKIVPKFFWEVKEYHNLLPGQVANMTAEDVRLLEAIFGSKLRSTAENFEEGELDFSSERHRELWEYIKTRG